MIKLQTYNPPVIAIDNPTDFFLKVSIWKLLEFFDIFPCLLMLIPRFFSV